MRLRTAVIILVPLLSAIAILSAIAFRGGISISLWPKLPRLQLVRQERDFASRPILDEVREIYTLTSIEYVYRSVFPFDYLHQDITIDAILQSLRGAVGTIEEILSQRQYEYWNAYTLARRHGFARSAAQLDFVVITVSVRAGFDLRDAVLQQSFETVADGTQAVAVSLPPAMIVEVIIEDTASATYPYPAFALSPEAWSAITEFVARSVTRRTIDDGILQAAEDHAQIFVTDLLQQAGFAAVTFVR